MVFLAAVEDFLFHSRKNLMQNHSRWHTHIRYPYLLAKIIIAGICIAILFVFLYKLRVVVIPILFAGFFAYILDPAVDFLCKKKIPRGVAAGMMVVLGVLIIFAIAILFIPLLFRHITELISRIPNMLDTAISYLAPFLKELGFEPSIDKSKVTSIVEENLTQIATPSGWIIEKVFSSAVTVVIAIINFIIFVVFTYYLLRDYDLIVEKVFSLIPPRHREKVMVGVRAVDEALSGFIRGQVIVSMTMGVIYSIALTLAGVDGGWVIGLISGCLNVVPYLGLITGLSLSLLSVGLDYHGSGQIIAVLAIYSAGPLLDTTFITPNLLGGRVGLNPFIVIAAILAGAEILGFLGLLLAVPTAAVIRALLKIWVDYYKESRFYKEEVEEKVDNY